MIVAVIPARAGSKRIPNKNIKSFAGLPIIAYSIIAARSCCLFDRVIVSTDSHSIADIARSFGAEVPFLRPAELSDDFVGTNAVIAHALSWLRENGAAAKIVCCIYATAPMISPDDLSRGLVLLNESGAKFAFSASEYEFPIQRALRLEPDGGVGMFQPEAMMSRSQDLEPAYHDAGQFYWGVAEAFEANTSIFDKTSRLVLLPRHRVVDIDTIDDWIYAEILFSSSQRLYTEGNLSV